MIGVESSKASAALASANLVTGRAQRKLPDDFTGFRDFVERRRGCLPRQLRLAADYLVAHPDEVAFDPLVTIGKRAGVSPSCIVRLSQRLGFDGFSQLQQLFRRRLIPAEPTAPPVPPPAIDPFHDSIEAMGHALRCLDQSTSRELLGRAIQVLTAAERVFVIGDGLSAGPALLAAETLRSAGCCTVVLRDRKAEADPAAVARTADACLVFDLGASGAITAPVLEKLWQREVATIVVANRSASARAAAGLIWLDLGQAGSPSASAATSAACLVLTMADMMLDHRQIASF